MNDFHRMIGKAIRGRRLELGLTQVELAQLTNMSHSTIVRIELGQQYLYLEQLIQIAQAMSWVDYVDVLPQVFIEQNDNM